MSHLIIITAEVEKLGITTIEVEGQNRKHASKKARRELRKMGASVKTFTIQIDVEDTKHPGTSADSWVATEKTPILKAKPEKPEAVAILAPDPTPERMTITLPGTLENLTAILGEAGAKAILEAEAQLEVEESTPWTAEELNRLTVKDLREMMTARGLTFTTSMTKAILIARIIEEDAKAAK